ncbi:putative Sugar transport protein 13 [Cocos nucifera]|nr:putative Sugar transport protein 13 [Cocos nucifera]
MGAMSKPHANAVVVLICTYVVAFAWSWGPLGWLVPSEIFLLEIWSAGQSIVNFLWTFIIAQFFLMALCNLKFGLFLLFAALVMAMMLFIIPLLSVTKNGPNEEIECGLEEALVLEELHP